MSFIAFAPQTILAETDSARVARLFRWASEGNVRYASYVEPAKDSLAQMGQTGARWLSRYLFTVDARERLRLAEIFEKMGTVATPFIVPYLDSAGEDAPRNAARCLERIKDTAAVMPLLAHLDHPEYSVRSQVATALGKTADRRALAPLIAALESDADSDVRKSCAVALGYLPDTAATRVLFRALNDEFYGVRQAAIRALAQHDQTVALPDGITTTPDVIVALGATGDPESRQWLRKLLDDPDPKRRGFAVEGLSQKGPLESAKAIAKLKAKETDPFVLAQIARFEQIVLEKQHEQPRSR
ncbi:MAG TPA: HEAT repeat domain-containing protein [bacterium]|nr:HEAT repeat domain-containing protein [bacterium]